MIEVIFTLDYEIYGNGEGSLKDLVYEPARRLKSIFDQAGAKLVLFVEAAELEKIASCGSDPAIHDVERQVREFHQKGHEIALHLHPQWCNATRQNGKWNLDYSEYNLCTLPRERITQIVGGAIAYLRNVLGAPDFTPFSFRAGNWLFQPTKTAANVLAEHGIKVDSSVFKGGVQHKHKLDYRPAARNGHYWRFQDDVNVPDHGGAMLEVPIYAQMVPSWKMATTKRIGLQQKRSAGPRTARQRVSRLLDFVRLWHPLKLDFCRMTLAELMRMTDSVLREGQQSPATYKPMVAIGHTKDLEDLRTVEAFLTHLRQLGIPVSTLEGACARCQQ